MAAHQRRTIIVDDVNIALQIAGAGSPILFLHGAAGVMSWLPFFDALAQIRELFVTDHPGFGQSEDPTWIRSVPDLAMFYLGVLETLNLRGVHVVGHSLGGWIAAEMAIRSCERIDALTLIAPAGIRVKGIPSGDDFIWSPEERVKNLFHDQRFSEEILSQTLTEEQIDVAIRNRFAAAKYGWQPRWFNPSLEKWLRRIKVPTHVIWGENDVVFPVAYADLWVQRLPNARVTIMKDCGHLPHVEQLQQTMHSMTSTPMNITR